MSTYFQVNNDRDSVIINDEFKNLRLIGCYKNLSVIQNSSYTFTNVPVNGPVIFNKDGYYLIVPGNPKDIVVAMSGEGGIQVSFVYSSMRYNRWVWKLDGGNLNSLEVYVFAFTDQLPKDNVGLAVYNANGEEVFNSSYNYMDVVDFIGDDQFPHTVNDGWSSKSYAQKVAFFPFNLFKLDIPSGNTSGDILYNWNLLRLDSYNSVTMGFRRIYSVQGNYRPWPYDHKYLYSNVIVIDVSHF